MTDEQRIVDLNIKLGKINLQLEEATRSAVSWRRRYEKYVRDGKMIRVGQHAAEFLTGMLANPGTHVTNEKAMVLAINLAKDFIEEIDGQWEGKL